MDQAPREDDGSGQSPSTAPVAARSWKGALLGAVFLMATSAVGPGFITQTTVFTAQLGAAFAFAILVSTLVDIAVQLNVWRVLGVSGMRAQDLANTVLPGAGYVLAALMVGYVAVTSGPPVGDALRQTVLPEEIDFLIIVTLIGGTVGGYITYTGAHRIIDSGISGPGQIARISQGSVTAIVVAAVMRCLLFLAVLGVVAGGATLAEGNPTASAFEHALGETGVVIFGVILWAASITSVIGASYTSVSFLATFSGWLFRHRNWVVVGFIVLSTAIYVSLGQPPVTLLILAGALNGLILPVGLGFVVWVALRRRDLLHGYRYPLWLALLGLAAWVLALYLGWESLSGITDLWQ